MWVPTLGSLATGKDVPFGLVSQCLSLLQPRASCFRLVSLMRRFFHALWFALLLAELSFNHCWFSSRYVSPSRLLVFMIFIFLDFQVERVTMYLYFVASVSMVIVALSVVAGEQTARLLVHCIAQFNTIDFRPRLVLVCIWSNARTRNVCGIILCRFCFDAEHAPSRLPPVNYNQRF